MGYFLWNVSSERQKIHHSSDCYGEELSMTMRITGEISEGITFKQLLAGYGLIAKRKKVSLRWSSGVSQWKERHWHGGGGGGGGMPSCDAQKNQHHICGVLREKMHYLKLIMREQSDQTEGHSTKYLLKMSKEAANCYRQKSLGMPLPDAGCDPALPPEQENTYHQGRKGQMAKCEYRTYVT